MNWNLLARMRTMAPDAKARVRVIICHSVEESHQT